jgi:uncharacterized protein (UPF0276 family)
MKIDRLGVGLGYRPELRAAIKERRLELDFVEVISESCFQLKEIEDLRTLSRSMPVLCHGLSLSAGTEEPLEEGYVSELQQVREHLHPLWFSDHLAVSRIGSVDLGHLAPMQFTHESVDLVARKIQHLSGKLGTFLLENITYYFALPGAEMTEADFITAVLEAADCGLLLDLNNLYVNSRNHDYNPYDFLDSIPLGRVVEVHVAGGLRRGEFWVDTHGEPVIEEVWAYLDYVCHRTSVPAVLLERDQNIPALEALATELRRARAILAGT